MTTPQESLVEKVAEALNEIGWTSTGDAQWSRLESAIPHLASLLASPSVIEGALPGLPEGAKPLMTVVRENLTYLANYNVMRDNGMSVRATASGALTLLDEIDRLLAASSPKGWEPGASDRFPDGVEYLARLRGCTSGKIVHHVLKNTEFGPTLDGSELSNAWDIIETAPLPASPGEAQTKKEAP